MSLWKRGLRNQGGCNYCLIHQETTLHALRDCEKAKELWMHMGVSSDGSRFWNSDLPEWLSANVRNGSNKTLGRWNDTFAVACWIIWRRRNEFARHQIKTSVWDGLAEIKGILNCMQRARALLKKPPRVILTRTREALAAAQSIRVFVDGAFSSRNQVAGCGGVLRSEDDVIVEAFMCSVPGNSSFVAELWGCIWGLRKAWEKGFRKVKLFCDASEILDWLEKEDVELHEDGRLIGVLHELMQRCWEV